MNTLQSRFREKKWLIEAWTYLQTWLHTVMIHTLPSYRVLFTKDNIEASKENATQTFLSNTRRDWQRTGLSHKVTYTLFKWHLGHWPSDFRQSWNQSLMPSSFLSEPNQFLRSKYAYIRRPKKSKDNSAIWIFIK